MQVRTHSSARGHVLRALLCVLVLLASGCGGTTIAPPRPPSDNDDQRAAGASALLQSLATGLEQHRRRDVLALAAPDAHSRQVVAGIYANADRLRISGLHFRYLASDDGDAAQPWLTRYGARAWAASVTASYRIPRYDPGPSRIDVELVFVATPQGIRLGGEGGTQERVVSWLTGPLGITSTPDTLVLTQGVTGAQTQSLGGYARRAVRAVRLVLPGWRGRLVVEVPASETQLEQTLAVKPGTYADIAAVTTTVDGSVVPGTPVHVFLNPGVFLGLQPRGRQVVLSHETTHVATRASFTPMPTWLLEGFADYVALDHAGIPVRVAASQILAEVRRSGAPTHLPTAADLSPSATGLGATYESAWTACRFLGQRYGEKRLIALYDAVRAGVPQGRAFRRVLGVSQATVVRGWRTDLQRLSRH